MIRRLRLLCALTFLAACDHAAPFAAPAPASLGPFSALLPRRLTFDPGSNRTPSVAGGVLLFSHASDAEKGSYPGAHGREECIAFMPVDGGSIQRMLCPDRYIPPVDTLVDTWYEPALSPDGRRIAFMWQRGYRVSAIAYLDAFLMVTDVDRPQDTSGVRHEVMWVRPDLPNPTRAGVATRITWLDGSHLRFLATREHIRKVKGGGAERVTDTTWDVLALQDLDLATGVATLVPGGDSLLAYAPAPLGGLWVVKDADSSALLHLDPVSGALAPVGRFSSTVIDLINVDGAPVAVVRDGQAIERLDLATGGVGVLQGFPGPVRRLAAAGAGRFVAEIEQDAVLFGAPPALWLFAVP